MFEQDQGSCKGCGAKVDTESFLHDLKYDPYELAKLIRSKAHAPVAEVLAGRLKNLMRQAGEEVPGTLHAPKKIGWLTGYPGEENLL